ncbi:MAG TPA: hypothetical protein VLG76_05105 [Rhabdochlamydiaceae bacterium]|nr:hypothetical protein [Rhabdochlamydiaceae bacterium]
MHPPSARVQISEKTPTAGKRKFREVDNFSSTTTPSKPLVKQRDSLGSCQNAIVLRVKQPDSLGPCQNAIVLKEEDLTNLEQQYPGLFALILSARGWKKTLCFRLIQTHVKDSSDVEYKISLFLFLLTKIQPVIGKLLRQVLAKEGMDRTFLIKEEINKLRTFEHNRNKLLELIKDEGYFHIQYGKKTASRHMQADFEKIDEYTRLFEKVEKFLEIS